MLLRSTLSASVLVLGGCATYMPQMQQPVAAHFGPVPAATVTPADAALACLARSPQVRKAGVFAVHVITDQTNKFATQEDGGYVPRDVAGMLVTSLQKAGVRQVNRGDTAVTEWEIARAKEQILGDGGPQRVGNDTVDFRPLLKGTVRGSDYVIDGTITQLDFNTYSGGAEVKVGGVGGGVRTFALTVAADLRVTKTETTEIALARSYSKQAVGTEIQGSVFRFFSNELFDINVGEKSQEGLHAGIRWMLADAAYDMVSTIVHHDGSCDQYLPEATQELRVAQGLQAHVYATKPT